jgi:integrase
VPKAKYKKRKDGRYSKQFVVGYSPEGKKKIVTLYGGTIEELDRKIDEFKEKSKNGPIIDKNITLSQWATEWLKLYKETGVVNTDRYYKSIVNRHVLSSPISIKKLSDVTTIDIQKLLNSISEEKPRTAQATKEALNQIFNRAIDLNLIYLSPMHGVKLPKTHRPEKRTLTEAEENAILNADFSERERAFVYLCLFCGLRRGEALALSVKESHVDMENRLVSVNQSIVFDGNHSSIKPSPKTQGGFRTNPMVKRLHDALLKYMKIREDRPYLFYNLNSDIISQTGFKRMWQSITDKISKEIGDQTDLTPHILRHTFATYLAAVNINPSIAQKLMGHSDPEMTMRVYTHIPVVNRYASSSIYKDFIELKRLIEGKKEAVRKIIFSQM